MNPIKYKECCFAFYNVQRAIDSRFIILLWMILFSGGYPLSILAQNTPPINGASTICQGDSTIFSVENIYKTYKWSTGDTTSSIKIKTGGSYAITVTDTANDTFKNAKTLIVNALPNANILGIPYVCNGRATTLSILTSYPTMKWSTGSMSKETFVSQPSTI
jgi:hypothetical protein